MRAGPYISHRQHPYVWSVRGQKSERVLFTQGFGAPFFHKYNNISTRSRASFFPLNNGPHTKTRRAAAFCNPASAEQVYARGLLHPRRSGGQRLFSTQGEREMLPLPLPLPVWRLSNFNIYKIVQCRERSRYDEKISGCQPLERRPTNKKLRTPETRAVAHLSPMMLKCCAEHFRLCGSAFYCHARGNRKL
jgi:hypothetical protein